MDPYSPCPGGTGKKIKFCCSDLVHELDKLERIVEGDQRVAALEYVTKLDEKYPGRACLLANRAYLEAALGNTEQSAATLATFREKHPENPTALAELAAVQANSSKPLDAIVSLEKAMSLCTEQITSDVYEALGEVAAALIEQQHYPAAQALLWFRTRISRGEDQQAMKLWASLEADPGIPIFLKFSSELEPPPAGAPWKYEFERALEPTGRMQWHTAAQKFTALAPIAGKSPVLWRNLARLRARIADYAGAAEAMRKIATSDCPLDDAVEAEATAITLDAFHRAVDGSQEISSRADQLKLTFTVANQSALEERFASDRQLDRLPIDPRHWQEMVDESDESQPPPKACFAVLDRPLPSSPDVGREQIPLILGTAFLFSRQTDRAERLELSVARADAAKAQEILRRIGGDALGDASENVIEPNLLGEIGFRWQFRYPEGMRADRRAEVNRQEFRHRLLEVWPDTPLTNLDGKTPRQAAADPALRVRVLANLLLMESASSPDSDPQAFVELRAKLNLPAVESIDPNSVNIAELPQLRLGRLQVEKLSDDDLIHAYARAMMPRQLRALESLAKEIVNRQSLADRPELAEAYGVLVSLAPDAESALQLVETARAAAQRAKQSTAWWDLTELRIRLERGDGPEVMRLLQHLQREHGKEPGVAESLFRLLYQFGLIDEYGQPAAALQSQPSSSIVVPGAAAPSKILVPGGETAPVGEASKPMIWTPGMD